MMVASGPVISARRPADVAIIVWWSRSVPFTEMIPRIVSAEAGAVVWPPVERVAGGTPVVFVVVVAAVDVADAPDAGTDVAEAELSGLVEGGVAVAESRDAGRPPHATSSTTPTDITLLILISSVIRQTPWRSLHCARMACQLGAAE
jgi:hypothetical protein